MSRALTVSGPLPGDGEDGRGIPVVQRAEGRWVGVGIGDQPRRCARSRCTSDGGRRPVTLTTFVEGGGVSRAVHDLRGPPTARVPTQFRLRWARRRTVCRPPAPAPRRAVHPWTSWQSSPSAGPSGAPPGGVWASSSHTAPASCPSAPGSPRHRRLRAGRAARPVPSLATAATAPAVLGVGVLGGYTTFSTYLLDTRTLLEAGQPVRAGLYLVGTLVTGPAATWLGIALGRALVQGATARAGGRHTDTEGGASHDLGRHRDPTDGVCRRVGPVAPSPGLHRDRPPGAWPDWPGPASSAGLRGSGTEPDPHHPRAGADRGPPRRHRHRRLRDAPPGLPALARRAGPRGLVTIEPVEGGPPRRYPRQPTIRRPHDRDEPGSPRRPGDRGERARAGSRPVTLVPSRLAAPRCTGPISGRPVVSTRHDSVLPWGTFTVNVAGPFTLGVIGAFVVVHGGPGWLLTVGGTGFCGPSRPSRPSATRPFACRGRRLAPGGRDGHRQSSSGWVLSAGGRRARRSAPCDPPGGHANVEELIQDIPSPTG